MFAMMLDTPVFKKLTRSEEYIDQFNQSVESNVVLDSINKQEVLYYSSPFSIMEALGIVVPKFTLVVDEVIKQLNIPSSSKANPSLDEIDLIFEHVFKLARNFYLNHEVLSEKKIKDFYKLQRDKYTISEGYEVFDNFISKQINTSCFRINLIDSIVYNYIMRLELAKSIDELIYLKYLMPTWLLKHEVNLQNSKFRLAAKIWNNILSLDENDNNIFDKQTKELIKNAIYLKPSKDFLDCDLIHYLTFGLVLSERIYPVLVFTEENIEKFIARIQLYLRLISEFESNSQIPFINKNPIFDIRKRKEGIVAFLNCDGSLRKVLKIEDIDRLP
jgi:hypothetical protein